MKKFGKSIHKIFLHEEENPLDSLLLDTIF